MISSELAGIQYMGEAGITQECLDAVLRLIQYDEQINKVKILSASGRHALLLTINSHNLIVIKSGFGTGYVGEGPRKFSYLLQLLDAHKIEMEEYEVDGALIDRLDKSALTESDISKIKSAKPVRPMRLHEYINDQHYQSFRVGTLWKNFRAVIPFAIIDSRITDLAVSFWENPDNNLLMGYRRLEDALRERTKIKEHGTKLFSKVFSGPHAILEWKNLDESEKLGRISLFTGAYMTYRNPRAHREIKSHRHDLLSEFLLLNHLYILEKEASKV